MQMQTRCSNYYDFMYGSQIKVAYLSKKNVVQGRSHLHAACAFLKRSDSKLNSGDENI